MKPIPDNKDPQLILYAMDMLDAAQSAKIESRLARELALGEQLEKIYICLERYPECCISGKPSEMDELWGNLSQAAELIMGSSSGSMTASFCGWPDGFELLLVGCNHIVDLGRKKQGTELILLWGSCSSSQASCTLGRGKRLNIGGAPVQLATGKAPLVALIHQRN